MKQVRVIQNFLQKEFAFRLALFEEMSAEAASARGATASGLAEEQEDFERDPLAKRETLELVRAYYRIGDPRVRKRVFELTKAVAGASDED